jgi:hypothetical protein
MSIRSSRILLGTLCSLLALATSAHAESAWVLWERATMSSPKVGGGQRGVDNQERP